MSEDERHKRFYSPDVNGYPIVPDMTYYPDGYKNQEEASEFEAYTLSSPEKPTVGAEEIFALKDMIHHRLKTVLLNLAAHEPDNGESKPAAKPEATEERHRIAAEVDSLMEKHFKQSAFQAFVSQVLTDIGKKLWNGVLADKAAAYLTKTAIRTILLEFRMRGLLSSSGKRKK